jgi:hypothetical protein
MPTQGPERLPYLGNEHVFKDTLRCAEDELQVDIASPYLARDGAPWRRLDKRCSKLGERPEGGTVALKDNVCAAWVIYTTTPM